MVNDNRIEQPNDQHLTITFNDTALLGQLFGVYDQNLITLENRFDLSIAARGNKITITGDPEPAQYAKATLISLYERLQQGEKLTPEDLESVITQVDHGLAPISAKKDDNRSIRTWKKTVHPKTKNQNRYMQLLDERDIVFALGPAGTGKTYIAVAHAVAGLMTGQVDHIILTRPVVEAGEHLGFLPGDMREKIDPYLRPIYDALHDFVPYDMVERRLSSGEIEIAPLAFMRGRTLSNAHVILDEAQNVTLLQMKMFLTRFGLNSRMTICGDPSQVDLPPAVPSGLADATKRLRKIEEIGFATLVAGDVMRHPLVGKIIDSYDRA